MTAPFIIGRSTVPQWLHETMVDQFVRTQTSPTDEIGHDLFDRVPSARLAYNAQSVRAAVYSLIGPHRLDRCIHAHLNLSPTPGDWHTDDYCGNPWPPSRRFVIVCYYPQTVTVDMGPTEVNFPVGPAGAFIPVVGPAGTFIAIRPDVWHRSTANTSGQRRVMFKFLAEATT